MAVEKIEVQSVVRQFEEQAHKGHVYEVGDDYPAKGFKATKARIEQLSDPSKNKYQKVYLKPKETESKKE
ncbi:hypothetical protein CF394_11280 [Tetzosporium hominis]|uniref:Uncharacterized protein n=1 Tax=Tetzosporium hominis TaxID=2020506 RepID=A0A264W1I2_9BACL|nr:hypothetical protein [Tetzosporium hominis]OZS77456.1 hypothetical protein CF394_11280 [Tetzosporium hominis]